MKKTNIASADEYIAKQAAPFQKTLKALRTLIRSEAPEAEEMISYEVICFKYLYMLVGIGVNSKYCSLYTMNPALAREIKTGKKDILVSGSTLHFVPGKPLPAALIRKIVRIRMQENSKRAELRKKKT